MFSNSSNASFIHYPALANHLTFAEYITRCRTMIKERRMDLPTIETKAQQIIYANSPFEFIPHSSTGKFKYGVLLIHVLFDCPFSLYELGAYLAQNGIVCRSILLPGHGTRPSDLLNISY